MHGPYHRFPRAKNLADAFQRQHPLVNPVQVNDVGFFKLTQFRDVRTTISYIEFKKVVALKMQMKENIIMKLL